MGSPVRLKIQKNRRKDRMRDQDPRRSIPLPKDLNSKAAPNPGRSSMHQKEKKVPIRLKRGHYLLGQAV